VLAVTTAMDDIHNVVFCDVTIQNGHNSVGTFYREPLGEIQLVVYYENIHKIEKGPR